MISASSDTHKPFPSRGYRHSSNDYHELFPEFDAILGGERDPGMVLKNAPSTSLCRLPLRAGFIVRTRMLLNGFDAFEIAFDRLCLAKIHLSRSRLIFINEADTLSA